MSANTPHGIHVLDHTFTKQFLKWMWYKQPTFRQNWLLSGYINSRGNLLDVTLFLNLLTQFYLIFLISVMWPHSQALPWIVLMILNPELHWFFKHTNPGKECTVDWLGLNPRLGETRCCRTQKTSIRALHRPVQIIRWVQQAWTCESLELFFYVSLSSPRVSHPFCLGEDNSTGTVVRDRRVLFFLLKIQRKGREGSDICWKDIQNYNVFLPLHTWNNGPTNGFVGNLQMNLSPTPQTVFMGLFLRVEVIYLHQVIYRQPLQSLLKSSLHGNAHLVPTKAEWSEKVALPIVQRNSATRQHLDRGEWAGKIWYVHCAPVLHFLAQSALMSTDQVVCSLAPSRLHACIWNDSVETSVLLQSSCTDARLVAVECSLMAMTAWSLELLLSVFRLRVVLNGERQSVFQFSSFQSQFFSTRVDRIAF